MTAPKPPEGFEVQKYPDVENETEVDLYVCTVCKKVHFDTFDIEAAKAHAAAGLHYPAPQALADAWTDEKKPGA